MLNREFAAIHRQYYRVWRKSNMKEKKGFFPVFNEFTEYLNRLSAGAIRMYIYLGIHSGNWTGESFHDLDKMAQFFEVNERTIRNWLKELENAKLISRMQLRLNGVTHTFLVPYPQSIGARLDKLVAEEESDDG